MILVATLIVLMVAIASGVFGYSRGKSDPRCSSGEGLLFVVTGALVSNRTEAEQDDQSPH